MSNLYFDESIRDAGGFIAGALVISELDLSEALRRAWRAEAQEDGFEYKSYELKANNQDAQRMRSIVHSKLSLARIACTVNPTSDRAQLGEHCAGLINQLTREGMLAEGHHTLYVDQNIRMSQHSMKRLESQGVAVNLGQDSRVVEGLQVADHVAHVLGSMLLEELGVLKKYVRAGENSGYDPDLELELGFELWASLRYSLIGKADEARNRSPGDRGPYFTVDGYGLYIAPTCDSDLSASARRRLGGNYLGCIH